MKIFVNDEEIRIFHGAKVIDVIRAYYRSATRSCLANHQS